MGTIPDIIRSGWFFATATDSIFLGSTTPMEYFQGSRVMFIDVPGQRLFQGEVVRKELSIDKGCFLYTVQWDEDGWMGFNMCAECLIPELLN